MSAKVEISARRLRRYQAADNVAKAMRLHFGTPHFKPEELEASANAALEWVLAWMDLSGKDRYAPPDTPPKRRRVTRL